MTIHGTPPWHLWGQTKTVNLVANAAAPVVTSSPQLTRVNYKRPDSFRFFFLGRLLTLNDPAPAGALVTVSFSVTIGVGLSMMTIDQFAFLSFDPAGAPPFYTLPFTKFAGSGLEPARTPGATTHTIDVLPAESIQVQATCLLQAGSGAGSNATVEVGAFFAPATHIRPEWFEQIGMFNGNENKGAK
jgi:hypothetical protein